MAFIAGARIKPAKGHQFDDRDKVLPRGVVEDVRPFGKGQVVKVGGVWFLSGYFEVDDAPVEPPAKPKRRKR